jgi:hypothetical protein
MFVEDFFEPQRAQRAQREEESLGGIERVIMSFTGVVKNFKFLQYYDYS